MLGHVRTVLLAAALAATLAPGNAVAKERTLALDHLTLVGSRAETVTYRGRRALHLQSRIGHEADDDSMLAIVPNSEFQNGTIELDVAGAPIPQVPNARGFIGLAFHVQARSDSFECLYIRPSNARVDDQLRRNHSVQYTSSPGFPWQRLRQEAPGVYETYADMESGVWIHLKLEVQGTQARFFVNGATQPTLIVNDLKLGSTGGANRALVPHVHRRLFRESAREMTSCRATKSPTPMTFQDHFSQAARDYARYRPRYPAALFAWLASLAPRRELAWDGGTGNGQAALGLIEHFDRVLATDASPEQLEHATPRERIEYRLARVEDVALEPGSVDLVTVGAAVHWFDLDPFYAAVRRALVATASSRSGPTSCRTSRPRSIQSWAATSPRCWLPTGPSAGVTFSPSTRTSPSRSRRSRRRPSRWKRPGISTSSWATSIAGPPPSPIAMTAASLRRTPSCPS